MIKSKILPGKTVSQIVCQVQRLIGQQSLKGRNMISNVYSIEFLRLHADIYAIGRENAKKTGVLRKNGMIINDGRTISISTVSNR